MILLDVYINPLFGGYERVNNKITYVNATINKANVLLKQPLGKYIYSPNVGNPLLNEIGLIPLQQVTNGINSCLQPLIQNGEITSVDIINLDLNEITQRYTINIKLNLPSGEAATLTWIK